MVYYVHKRWVLHSRENRAKQKRGEEERRKYQRRGGGSEDEEDEETGKGGRAEAFIWKKPKKVKTKVEHKTYEQIAEAGQESVVPGIGQIIDATSAVVRT